MVKRLRAVISVILIINLLSAGRLFVSAESDYEDASKYSYSVSPVLAPFNYVVYVKTDNPDPTSFRLYDYDSRYYTAEAAESDESSDTEIPCFELYPDCFSDVEYENRETKRVNGGYIFYCPDQCSDGGELVVQQKTGESSGVTTIYYGGGDSSNKHSGVFEDTDIKVACGQLKSTAGYLTEYANSKGGTLFDKLDAVQSYLDKYAVYPFGVYDESKPTGFYPSLAASRYYPELSLNTHCEIVYNSADDMLLYCAYPFILNSASFPAIMQIVAQSLEPDAEITAGNYHPYINVTFDGKTQTYGGAGSGSYDSMPLSGVDAFYTFKSDSGDLSKVNNLDKYKEKLFEYKSIADEAAQEMLDPIAGETYRKTIAETGGTFIKILTEGFITGFSYAYVMPNKYGSITALSNTWVKGRYISEYEYLYTGCTFEDFPNANILVDDYEYTDKNGEKHVEDVLFYYDETNDNWSAESYYGSTWGDETVPDEFFLSREQVVKMDVDKNGGILPESGLIYDGTAEPGTPFTNILVQGVSLPESAEVPVGETTSLTAEIVPNNAGEKYCIWESSDENVVIISYEDDETCRIKGVSEGTATVKVTTFDGRYVGECLVTVGHSEEKIEGKAATCTETGLTEGVKCSFCGKVIKAQEKIPALGHKEEKIEGKAATCTETGLTEGTKCSVCGKIIKAQEKIPALGHKEVKIEGKAATCTETGLTEGTKCSVCGKVVKTQEKIPALGHKEVKIEGKAATCTETGLTEGTKCSVCGKIIKAQEEIPSLGHKEVKIEGKAATCTETGISEGTKCSVCGKVVKSQEETPALGHKEVKVNGKSATCTETGLTDGTKCSVCGAVVKAQKETPALGHSYTDGVCSVCGAIDPDYKLILKKGSKLILNEDKKFIYVTPEKTSGVTASELKAEIESNVKFSISDDSAVVNGYSFKFGVNEYTVIVIGDTSPDGKITARDARAILRISARLDKPDDIIKESADINRDSKVTSKEARSVLRFAARLQSKID